MSSTNPLSTPKFRAWLETEWRVNNPVHAKEAAISLLLSRGTCSRLEAELEFNANGNSARDIEAYEIWASGAKVYTTKDIHRELGVLTPYPKWRWRYQLPVTVSAAEAAFLIKEMRPTYLTPADNARLDSLFDEPGVGVEDHVRRAAHPAGFRATEGDTGRTQSKVGRTYGTFLLEACLSDSENTGTGDKVMYRCRCTLCGTQRDIAYHSLRAVVCRACGMRKAAGRSMDPLVLYISADGRVMKPFSINNVPEDAIALVRLNEYDKWTELVPMTSKAIKANLLLQPIQDHEGEIHEVLKPEEAEAPKPMDPHDIALPNADDFVKLDELPEMDGFNG